MNLQVLISCMHQKDHSIIERTNIQSDVIVINQCDIDKREEFSFVNKKGDICNALFISTTERGLSKSRNMAIRNATSDVCLICDDDEILEDDYIEKIIKEHQSKSNISIIAFNLNDRYRTFPQESHKIGYIRALKLASWQISFKLYDINTKHISFDESMGAGVTMGGSEENKFLIECIKNGLKGVYVPILIGSVSQEISTWAVDSNNCVKYFKDRGQAYRKLMGGFLGFSYIFYSSIKKRNEYRKYMSLRKSIYHQIQGLIN